MLLTIGSRLGPYEILATLGEGGMGEVYRARDSRLGREVAIKVLQHGFSNSDGWARFEREARAASALSHPNICAVYDVGEADGRPFLVLELIEGVTLRHYIDNQPMEASAVLAVGIQIADALEAAHAKGIVHRDIKSSNVMIAGRRHVKVLDFGLAKQTAVAEAADAATREQLTMAGAVVGTPHYLAPELLRGAPADARSDVWAFGVVLYEMLAGRVPFSGSTPFAIGEAIVSEPLPPLPASVPPGLRAVVDRCLARRAADRYQHAGEVRAAFDALQSGREPETPRVASGAPRRRLFPVKRAWWWAAGAVAAALVASVAVWLFSARPQVRLVSTGGPASSNQQANEAFELAMQFQTVQNDLERGRVALERAIQLDPQFAEARRFHALTSVFLILNGYSNDTSLLYRAEEELRAATAIDPTLTGLPSSYAAVYITQGRRELVPWAALERELQSDPRHPTNRLWKGIGLWLSGDIAGAKREFRTTLDFLPLFGAARMFYAETLRNEGDVGGAIRESTQRPRTGPEQHQCDLLADDGLPRHRRHHPGSRAAGRPARRVCRELSVAAGVGAASRERRPASGGTRGHGRADLEVRGGRISGDHWRRRVLRRARRHEPGARVARTHGPQRRRTHRLVPPQSAPRQHPRGPGVQPDY